MGEFFTYFSITGLINAIVSLGFALYLTLTSWRMRVARYLVYLCLALGTWSTGYFLWQISTTPEQALFWARGLMVGAIFTSISFLHLVVVFLQLDKKRFYRIMLILFYIPSFIFEIVNFTPLLVSGVGQRLFFQFWPLPGPFLLPQVLLFGVHIILASSLLYKKYRHSIGDEKKQAFMLLVGITTTFVGGGTNYFLWFNIPIAPWGNGVASAYAIMSVYAIMRYGFLNLKVVTAELFTGLLVVLSFVDILLSQESGQLVFNVVKLLLVLVFGYILIKSVHHEIRRREEMVDLAHSLEKANLRLKELDRQKTEFLSIASHQLRTPLSIMKGYIELLKDGAFGRPTSGIVKTLGEMDDSNEHLIKLIDDFLDVTRIEQGRTKFDFAWRDLNKIISQAIRELQEKAEPQGMKIIWQSNPAVKKVYLDEEKIHHVIYNFIDNATKYNNGGRKIWVSADRDKDRLVVKVKDEGIGFGPEDEVNFFQKFYRGVNVKGTNVNGTGLGLYVCKKFIEAHQGEVWASSAGLGKGAEFGFWIPIGGKGNVESGKSVV